MPLEKLEYSKNWENPQDFPTYEAREEKVRADIQLLFDEAKNAFNKMIDDLAADLVPFSSSPAIPASTVQSAIEAVQQQIEDIVLGELPDRSIAGEKIVEGGITGAELGEAAVGAINLADDCVTSDKIAPDAIEAEHIAPGAVGKEAFAEDALSDKADLVNNRVPAAQLTKRVLKPGLSTTYSLVLSDAGAILYCSNSSSGTISIPSNTSVAFPVGTEILVYQGEVGSVTFTGATGVSILVPDNATPSLQKRCSAAKLVKTSTNQWNILFLGFLPAGTVGTSQLAGSAVTNAKLASGAVGTAKIADASVTRAKLANDTLYSPIASTVANQTPRAIKKDDIGKTLLFGWVSGDHTIDTEFTLSLADSSTMPLGAEIAIYFMHGKSCTIKFTGGLKVDIMGEGRADNRTVRIPEKYGMAALKKMLVSNGTDYWLVTGNVEVVS